MDSSVPDPLHFSLSNAITFETEFLTMPAIDLSKPSEQQSIWSLIFGITFWFLHMNLLNALISVACKWGWLTFPVGALSGLQFVEAIVSLITVLLILFLIYLPWRNWQSFQTEKPRNNPELLQDTEEHHRPLIAFVAMLVNFFLFLFVIATFIPMFALKTCGQV